MSDLRPRRSVLYMPAANERALEKAKSIPADAIIFDLEDAVAPDAKEAARANACAAASSGECHLCLRPRRHLPAGALGLSATWRSTEAISCCCWACSSAHSRTTFCSARICRMSLSTPWARSCTAACVPL